MSSSVTLNPPRTQETTSSSRRPGPKLVAAIAIVVLAVVGFVAVKALTSDDGEGKLAGSGSDRFSLTYPHGWSPASKQLLGGTAGAPIAGLRRDDGSGFLFVRQEGRAPRNFGAFSDQLTRELDRRVPDFQKRSARIVKVAGGQAFFYSYIRTKKGTVHTVIVLPAGQRSYALNTVSIGGREDTAREIAQMILSFKAGE